MTKREDKRIAVAWKLMDMFKIENAFEVLDENAVYRKEQGRANYSRMNHRRHAERLNVWIESLERDAGARAARQIACRGEFRTVGHVPRRTPAARAAALQRLLAGLEPGALYRLSEIRRRYGVMPLEIVGRGIPRKAPRIWFEFDRGWVRLSLAGLEARARAAALD